MIQIRTTSLLLLLVYSLTFTLELHAQENQWIFIKKHEGVVVSWRYRKELKDQFISELKFENSNNFPVKLNFYPSFDCGDGNKNIEASKSISLNAKSAKGGQSDGLFWYPCPGSTPLSSNIPLAGGFMDLVVSGGNIKSSNKASLRSGPDYIDPEINSIKNETKVSNNNKIATVINTPSPINTPQISNTPSPINSTQTSSSPTPSTQTPTVVEAQEWVLSKLRKYPKTSETVEEVGNLIFMTKKVSASDFKFTDDGKLTMIEHFEFGGTDKIFDNKRREFVAIDIKYFKKVSIEEDHNLLLIEMYGDNTVATHLGPFDDESKRTYKYSNCTVNMDITAEPNLHIRMEKALNDIKKHYTALLPQSNEKY